jgi:hypothetical protein
MNNAAKGGAPPPKEVAAAQVSGPEQRRDFGNGRGSQHNTEAPAASPPAIGAPQWPMSAAQLERWGERAGIPVVPITGFHLEKLFATGTPAWIAYDYWCCDDEELAFALAHATQVIIADDVDRFNHVAAGVALDGERVLLLDWPEGTPLPLRGGGGA